MKVLVTGATGLVGRRLCLGLLRQKYQLIVLGRSPEAKFRENFQLPCEYYSWDELAQLPAIDAVIHLAGDSIAEGRWTQQKKQSILNSRVETSRILSKAFAKKGQWPKVYISASAIGYYGPDKSNKKFTEEDDPGEGFLAEVCKEWEKSSAVYGYHSRVVKLRIGVILDCLGGMLAELEPLFSMGLAGKVASGKQYLSWIHHQDLINLILYSLENENMEGVYNAVAPEPITNKEFTQTLATQFKVPAFIPAPALALQIALGEKSQLALNSQKVSAVKTLQTGFEFQYSNLKSALQEIYQWKKHPMDCLFHTWQWLPRSKQETFPFFCEAKNLEKITPPWLNFRVLKQSSKPIQLNTNIEYKLKLHGLPISWKSEITNWDAPNSFSDNQLRGPYKHWFHTHTFEELAGGTLLGDQVVYRLPMGKLGKIVAGNCVKNDINKIFHYRKSVIEKLK